MCCGIKYTLQLFGTSKTLRGCRGYPLGRRCWLYCGLTIPSSFPSLIWLPDRDEPAEVAVPFTRGEGTIDTGPLTAVSSCFHQASASLTMLRSEGELGHSRVWCQSHWICAPRAGSYLRTAHFFLRHWKQPSRLRLRFSPWPGVVVSCDSDAEREDDAAGQPPLPVDVVGDRDVSGSISRTQVIEQV